MSLLAQDSKFPVHTLRGHTSSITASEFVRVPISTRAKTITLKEQHNKTTLKPFLLSADDSGKLILWDLTILRPLKTVQGHNTQVLTIRQLGIKDNEIDSRYFGLVLTHGRDHTIKFWKIFDESGVISFDLVYELPVNALNFSNVDIIDDIIVTPNTQNSNTFDIYDISFLSHEKVDDSRLKRLFEAVDVYKTAVERDYSKFEEFNIKRDEMDDDVNRTDKFGIIMKLLFITKELLFIGYESGHVAQIRLNRDSKTFEIINIEHQHYPNPVLSLTFDKIHNVVLSTSIGSNIVIHSLEKKDAVDVKLSKFGKISGVAVVHDKYIISSWNGYIRFYKLGSDHTSLEYLANFKKPKGLLAGDLNIIGNINNDAEAIGEKSTTIKPTSLEVYQEVEVVDPLIKKGIHRRDLKVIETSCLAVGYGDGTITLYNDL
ncbi:putative WD repeat-containing protein [Wickerhamomyces ciferrii]|uniref:ASTRA-associated protein 1 n=1 Tax=Wickerhamomyces ciferrii (strain ATCC 14091 / BCRC 22168 / CBS 111 / JCM 3599 / NBRC 0793 / NRRL Y-1031 F-60-10) TaxID=1206466 RepID=K0KJ76_WICCF|nr:putative WD repeat-containing protein [Wickerhamomyces ciferrii]CCH42187.1 putative WD repeat-containing protein [Wickerhamomyces ciferrii]